jgi:hypothetical protein
MMFEHDKQFLVQLGQYNAIVDILKESKLECSILENICSFIHPKKYIFTELTPSTLTAQGRLSNVSFNEQDLILALKPSGSVKKIGCNYGIVYNSDYDEPEIPVKKSNRGRKPKDKKKKNRKNQGNGKFFNSQLTLYIQYAKYENKLYKAKLFRNGTIEIPGGLEPSMGDIKYVSDVICEAIGRVLVEDVNIINLYSIMRNYKFTIISNNALISINKLKNKFIQSVDEGDALVKDVCQIKYNSERYPGLIVKFSTPIPTNLSKETTIKMFQSGKVNIDGSVSEEQAWYYYNILNEFYLKHSADIMFIPKVVNPYTCSDSDSGID